MSAPLITEREPSRDGGRVRLSYFYPDGPALDRARELVSLLERADDEPDAAVLAYELADKISRLIGLPHHLWVACSIRKPHPVEAVKPVQRMSVWSAHYTRREAKIWSDAWHAHWEYRYSHSESPYQMMVMTVGEFVVASERHAVVSPHYLRHPDADPATAIDRR